MTRPTRNRPEDTDDNEVLDAQDDDWAWRRRLRAHPVSSRIYRATVAVLGAAVVGFGLFTVPAPGPGWVIVFFGLSIWASEFEWAQRLLRWSRRLLSRWNAGVRAAPVVRPGRLGCRHERRRRPGGVGLPRLAGGPGAGPRRARAAPGETARSRLTRFAAPAAILSAGCCGSPDV